MSEKPAAGVEAWTETVGVAVVVAVDLVNKLPKLGRACEVAAVEVIVFTERIQIKHIAYKTNSNSKFVTSKYYVILTWILPSAILFIIIFINK